VKKGDIWSPGNAIGFAAEQIWAAARPCGSARIGNLARRTSGSVGDKPFAHFGGRNSVWA